MQDRSVTIYLQGKQAKLHTSRQKTKEKIESLAFLPEVEGVRHRLRNVPPMLWTWRIETLILKRTY